MTTKEGGKSQDNTQAFASTSEVVIGNKVYLIERHFTGNRDYTQAIFTAAENEAKRNISAVESAKTNSRLE